MRTTPLRLSATIALGTFLICLAPVRAAENPVHWSLESVPQKPLSPGAKFSAKLLARIDSGWHLYSLDEEDGGPIPTEISLPDQSPLTLGAIRAPKSIQLLDPNFNKVVSFYLEEVDFTLPLTVSPDSPSGPAQTSVRIRYQCCNQSMCLPPRTAAVDFSITVKPKK